MATISIRLLTLGFLVMVTAAAPGAAQAPPALLSALEVRTLVSNAAADDHARLSAHFAALADRYEREARRHEAMARAFVGNPNRNSAIAGKSHCAELAEQNTRSAATTRAIAAHHATLARGEASTRPADAARFEAGEGAPEPTEVELTALAARAATPAEHRAVQEYFLTIAKRYTAEASEHTAMAASYAGTRIAQAATHCNRLVAEARESAREATEAAAKHGQFANVR
jgi:hypothetical protein